MNFPRRTFLHLAAGAAALRTAKAQTYPARPVTVIVPFAAGGATDIFARLIGQWLSDRLGQQFVVENRPGAATNIGAAVVVKAAPDGYTLLLASTSGVISATLYQNLNFNFVRDIAPVAGIVRTPLVLLLHPSVPATTVPELIAHAKANPGKISIASLGTGTTPSMAAASFKLMAGIELVEVPYRGDNPAITDLLGGHVQMYFGGVAPSIEHIRSGKLRALAVTTAARSETLPDLPTMGDFLPGFEVSVWYGVGAPRNTPVEIVDRLNKEVNAALADPKIKARLAEAAGVTLTGSATDFGKFMADEAEKWGKVIRAANIKPD